MRATTFSHRLSHALDAVRDEFGPFRDSFAALTASRVALAPRLLAAWTLWQRETKRSFIAFVRELDRSVPAERAAYTRHRSYQAALYLKDLATKPPATRRSVSAFRLLAIVIKSVRPAVKANEETTFKLIEKASRWRPRDMERLRKAVKRARPIPFPGIPQLGPPRRFLRAV